MAALTRSGVKKASDNVMWIRRALHASRSAMASMLADPETTSDSALATWRNSTTSIRRSSPSYLATKDCGFCSRSARSIWVSPAYDGRRLAKRLVRIISRGLRVEQS